MDARTAMAVEPKLLELADLLKERFGAKLTWLKTADMELGRPPVPVTKSLSDPARP